MNAEDVKALLAKSQASLAMMKPIGNFIQVGASVLGC